jgi:hypothetical protein
MVQSTVERMTAWREYQERAANFFRSLGLYAKVDERMIGARGQHDVDVVVRGSLAAGIEQIWIVECKFWGRRVDKSHVGNLMTIVNDVGADRGILLSERGFQRGAFRLASLSNITLTSLSGLENQRFGEAICLHDIAVEESSGMWLCDTCGMVQPTDWE